MEAPTLGSGTPGASQVKLMADINVTPMVDVMLVLLVIFMVTAPLLVAGLPVDLPKSSAQPIGQPNKPLVVTLTADRTLLIRGEQVDEASLISRLAALRASEGDTVVYVRADQKIAYGEVMELLSWLSASGYQRISLLSRSQSEKDGKAAPQAGAPTGAEAK